jgi:hypothetical protein
VLEGESQVSRVVQTMERRTDRITTEWYRPLQWGLERWTDHRGKGRGNVQDISFPCLSYITTLKYTLHTTAIHPPTYRFSFKGKLNDLTDEH